MTFLQPFILWGLPLILLPVIIHFINRLRHRRQRWAAMQFLLAATRSSVSHARLRQMLVLLFRVLAVLALILFLSRPLAGGWLGWAVSAAPDTVLLLLDRSASMETRVSGTQLSRREQALRQFAAAAAAYQGSTHLVLLDSAARSPQEIGRSATLTNAPLTAATDTAADLPGMLQTALRWLTQNRAGTTELWIASDLQHSNWRPEDSRWPEIVQQLTALPQTVRVRLLTFGPHEGANAALALREMSRRRTPAGGAFDFVLDLQRTPAAPDSFPVTLHLDGLASPIDLVMSGTSLRWRHRVDLGTRTNAGWGRFTLPADDNQRDNTVHFVFGPEMPARALVVSEEPRSSRFLSLAASVLTGLPSDQVRVSGRDLDTTSLQGVALILWQGPLPDERQARHIEAFADEGGSVVFFPPAGRDTGKFQNITWGETQRAENDQPFAVRRWDEDQGPLARTDEGISLPLNRASIVTRQELLSTDPAMATLAAYADGARFLARKTTGRGGLYFCTTLPRADWSDLGEGSVLVPMIQRLLQSGTRRLENAIHWSVGEVPATERSRGWTAVDPTAGTDPSLAAGVYQSGSRLAAVNRPDSEDDWTVLDADRARSLFAGIPVRLFEERAQPDASLQGEVWRWLLAGMLVFLLVEGFLILPARGARTTAPSSSTSMEAAR